MINLISLVKKNDKSYKEYDHFNDVSIYPSSPYIQASLYRQFSKLSFLRIIIYTLKPLVFTST